MERDLHRRILDISYKEKLSHIGSCLSAVDAIEAVYQIKRPEDKFVLSNGHAALALYTVLEKYHPNATKSFAEELLHKHGVHPNRDTKNGLEVSTGSLGQGLPIALGMAMASPEKRIYCMVSDGEMAEGSVWEALAIGEEQNITNLKIICNANGYGAYRDVDEEKLIKSVAGFGWQVDCVNGHNIEEIKQSLEVVSPFPHFILARTISDTSFSRGLDSHYKVMNEEDYLKTK